MLGLNNPGACTGPADTAGIIIGSELDLLVDDAWMTVVAEIDLDDIIFDAHVLRVITDDVVSTDHARNLELRHGLCELAQYFLK